MNAQLGAKAQRVIAGNDQIIRRRAAERDRGAGVGQQLDSHAARLAMDGEPLRILAIRDAAEGEVGRAINKIGLYLAGQFAVHQPDGEVAAAADEARLGISPGVAH